MFMRVHLVLFVVLSAVATASSGRIAVPRAAAVIGHVSQVRPANVTTPQGSPIPGRPIAAVTPPVVIDGAVTPDAIPDAVAYRHFLIAAAGSEKPTPAERVKLDGLVGRIGLSDDDRAAFSNALKGMRDALDNVTKERNQVLLGSANARAVLTALKGREDKLVQTARARLESWVTAEGRALLETHIKGHVKRHIKIYGNPLP